jgi:hypothetical protein
MKKNILIIVGLIVTNLAFCQVGIDNTDPKATLDVTGKPAVVANLDGIIPPRLTGAELNAKSYSAAQTGAIVYITNPVIDPTVITTQTVNIKSKGLYYFDGSVWQIFAAQNSKFTDGTNPANAVFTTGNVGIGTTAPENILHIVPATNADPLKISNINAGSNTNQILTQDANGVVKKIDQNKAIGNLSQTFNLIGGAPQTLSTTTPVVNVNGLSQQVTVPVGETRLYLITITGYVSHNNATDVASHGFFGLLLDGVKQSSIYASAQNSNTGTNALVRLPFPSTYTTVLTLTGRANPYTINVNYTRWSGTQEINTIAFPAYGGSTEADINALKSRLTIVEFNTVN